MPERNRSNVNQFARELTTPLLKSSPIGLAVGLLGVGGIELFYHRGGHGVLKTSERARGVFRAEQASLGVGDDGTWEMVHRDHHRSPDAATFQFYRLFQAVEAYKTTHPHTSLNLPDSLPYMDPYVKNFPTKIALKIGGMDTEFVSSRIGPSYKPQVSCTDEELAALLNPARPTYYYPARVKRPRDYEYSQDEIAQALLSDPHSLSLLSPSESFPRRHLGLYKTRAGLYAAKPDLKDPDLQSETDYEDRSHLLEVVAGIMLPAVATLAVRKKFSPKDFMIASLVGGAFMGERALVEIEAGKIVNLLGHIGPMDQKRLRKILTNQPFYIIPNADGTVATDLSEAGILGKVIGFATGGDAGQQSFHHINPGENVFTDKAGVEAFAVDPFGVVLEALAENKHIDFIQPGDNFNLKPGEKRPDEPTPAVEMIHALRRRDLKTGETPITWRRLYPKKKNFKRTTP